MEMVLGSFTNYDAAYEAIINLENLGLTDENISVVSKCVDRVDMEFGAEFNLINDTREDLVSGVGPEQGKFGELGALIEPGTVMNIPELGSTMILGALTRKVEGAASERMLGALVQQGVNRTIAEKIEDDVKAGKTIITVEDDNLNQATEVLKNQGASISLY